MSKIVRPNWPKSTSGFAIASPGNACSGYEQVLEGVPGVDMPNPFCTNQIGGGSQHADQSCLRLTGRERCPNLVPRSTPVVPVQIPSRRRLPGARHQDPVAQRDGIIIREIANLMDLSPAGVGQILSEPDHRPLVDLLWVPAATR
ncbi:hypothetical protein [Nocardia tengchongensis]|uniref:hypothetical protein n=1 Tax=Nocardia tengchongensis TaxID=2055889 RepID=UPI003684E38F